MSLTIKRFQEPITRAVGPIQQLIPIEKGFSAETKVKLTTAQGEFLARLAPLSAYQGKAAEFTLMQQLYEKGVQCNRPIVLLQDETAAMICSLFSYVPGVDAEEHIATYPTATQYQVGLDAGCDLKRINSLSRATNTWKARKWQKHERYVARYFQQAYRLKNDKEILRFIETHYDFTEADRDYLQHDDFHLGNIVLYNQRYGGVVDFGRYDWGDPLHEFVKLEWFTWPVSEAFARGQVMGYFGKQQLDDATCLQLAVYIAMSIFSTLVWTLSSHPHIWPETERHLQSILTRFDDFEVIRPQWAT